MASIKNANPFLKLNDDTGFSNTGVANGGRFINRDGSFNLKKKGWPFWDRLSLYYIMISMPLWKFMSIIVLFFIGVNLLFTSIYLWLGASGFTGLLATTPLGIFKETYFFSTETFTTVGYGRVNPIAVGVSDVRFSIIRSSDGFNVWKICAAESTSRL